MYLMKDTKEYYKYFTNFFYLFNFFNTVSENGLPSYDKGYSINNLKIVSPQYLKIYWAYLMKGGEVKLLNFHKIALI